MPTKATTLALLHELGPPLGLYVASVLKTRAASLPVAVQLDGLAPDGLGDRFDVVLSKLRNWATRRFGPQGWHLQARYGNGRRVGYELRLPHPGGTRLLRLVVALILRRAGLDERLVRVR